MRARSLVLLFISSSSEEYSLKKEYPPRLRERLREGGRSSRWRLREKVLAPSPTLVVQKEEKCSGRKETFGELDSTKEKRIPFMQELSLIMENILYLVVSGKKKRLP